MATGSVRVEGEGEESLKESMSSVAGKREAWADKFPLLVSWDPATML